MIQYDSETERISNYTVRRELGRMIMNTVSNHALVSLRKAYEHKALMLASLRFLSKK